MALEKYAQERNFKRTPEPTARVAAGHHRPIFVVQEHHARRLHYDFRLEADGVLKSWAVPKEPTLDPAQKRLAIHVEDHPLKYATFAGTIPEGQYGAGKVAIWDHGTYENLLEDKPVPQTVAEGIDAGHLEFALHGEKLHGRFALIRMRGFGHGKDNWLLIKMKDESAQPDPPAPPRSPSAGCRTLWRHVSNVPKRVRQPNSRTSTRCSTPTRTSPRATCSIITAASRRGFCRISRIAPSRWSGCPTGSATARRTSGRRTSPQAPGLDRPRQPADRTRQAGRLRPGQRRADAALLREPGCADVAPLVLAHRRSRHAGLRPL